MLLRVNKFLQKNWLILSILFLAAFLRFWKLSELLHFTLDEELEAFIVKNIVTGFHQPAIGISVAPVGIHLSPIFYYIVAIPFWIGNQDPLSWGIFASVIGVITTLVFYLTTKKMFSPRIAVWATLLYSGSFLMVLYDKHFWNVMFMPIISMIVIFSLFQLIKKKYIWVIPLSLVLALGLSSHLSSFSLLLLTVLVLYRDKISVWKKQFLVGVFILALSQAPLIIFELRHQFYQLKVLTKFLTGEHSGINLQRIMDNVALLPKVYSRLLYTFGSHDFAREQTYGILEISSRDTRIPIVILLISLLLLIYFGYLVYKNKKNHAYKLHAALLAITIFSLVIYGILFKGNLFEFYLSLLFPTLFIVTALFLDKLWLSGKKYKLLSLGLVTLFLVANINALVSSYHSYGLAKKLAIISWVEEKVKDQPYELHSIGVDHKYEGYRYLFEKFYKAPLKSYVDPQLAWLYQSPVATTSPNLMVVLSSSEQGHEDQINQEKNLYLSNIVDQKQFGEIDVMIVNNLKN